MCFFLHHTSTYPQGSHHKHRVFGPRFFYRAPRAGGLLFFFTFTERVWPFLAGVLSGLLVLAPTAVAEALGTRLAAVGSVCGLPCSSRMPGCRCKGSRSPAACSAPKAYSWRSAPITHSGALDMSVKSERTAS